MRRWSFLNKHPMAEYDKSSKTDNQRFLFEPVLEEYKMRMNLPYCPRLLNSAQAAYFLDVKENDVREAFRKAEIDPAYYRKKSVMYTVNSVIKLAKKLQRPFVIPVGFFSRAEHIFVGSELSELSRTLHNARTRIYTSLFEMYMEEGIPVQNVYIAPSIIQCVEGPFLTVAGKMFDSYNKAAKGTGKGLRHLYLCTKPKERELANKLANHYNIKFPSFIVSIDLDYLQELRERQAKKLKEQSGVL